MPLSGGFRADGEYPLEPTIDELLADPLIRLLMASDKVDAVWLYALMIAVGRRIGGTDAAAPSR